MAAGSQAGGPSAAAAVATPATPQHSLHDEIASFVAAVTGVAGPPRAAGFQHPTMQACHGARALHDISDSHLLAPETIFSESHRFCRDSPGARRQGHSGAQGADRSAGCRPDDRRPRAGVIQQSTLR